MSANDDFGKDLGLMSEVVVTGRKAGMGKAAWAFLAHNGAEFSALAPLIEHWAVIKKNEAEVNVVSLEKAEELIQTVTTIANGASCGCLHCGHTQRRHLHYLYVPTEILTIDADERHQYTNEDDIESVYQRQEEEYLKYFYNFIANGLIEIGIYPAELARYSQFSCGEEECLTLDYCCSGSEFSEAVRKIVRQRNVLASIVG